MKMETNKLLQGELQYQLLLATHSVLRTMGFPADDIYTCIGKNPCVMLKRNGIEFIIEVGGELAKPYDQFCEEWTHIVEHLHEVSGEAAAQALSDWRERLDLRKLIMAIAAKGITIPEIERHDRHELN